MGVAIILVAAVGLNAVLCHSVITDTPGGWADLAVLLAFGPLVNGMICIVSLCFSFKFYRRPGNIGSVFYVMASVFLPLIGYWIDYLLITGGHLR